MIFGGRVSEVFHIELKRGRTTSLAHSDTDCLDPSKTQDFELKLGEEFAFPQPRRTLSRSALLRPPVSRVSQGHKKSSHCDHVTRPTRQRARRRACALGRLAASASAFEQISAIEIDEMSHFSGAQKRRSHQEEDVIDLLPFPSSLRAPTRHYKS